MIHVHILIISLFVGFLAAYSYATATKRIHYIMAGLSFLISAIGIADGLMYLIGE